LTFEEKQAQLIKLYDEWAECERCGLCAPENRRRHHVVFGDGNPDAALMIVGEAPGEKEDITGAPFKGASGKAVDRFLGALDSSREEVFITNVVACRPTDETGKKNRKPDKEEIAECAPRLHQIINIVDPFVVLMLGNTPLKALTQAKGGITKYAKDITRPRLQVVTPGLQVPVTRDGFATFHPSFLLRKWEEEEGSDVHRSFLTWEKAFKVADMYAQIYRGIEPPLRGE
jgi:DNA polymerase